MEKTQLEAVFYPTAALLFLDNVDFFEVNALPMAHSRNTSNIEIRKHGWGKIGS